MLVTQIALLDRALGLDSVALTLSIAIAGSAPAISSGPPPALGLLHGTEPSDDSSSEEDEPPVDADAVQLSRSWHGAALRSAARVGAPVRSWLGAIPSADDRAALTADAIALVDREGGQSYWIDAALPPRCSLERYALAVLAFHQAAGREGPSSTPGASCGCAAGGGADGCPACGRRRSCVGAEWWVQVRRSDGRRPNIGLHWDSDEERKKANGEHVPPWLATVSYLGDVGAPTLVLPIAADAHGAALPPLRFGGGGAMEKGIGLTRAPPDSHLSGRGAFLSFPVAGKHLAFDGRLLHGAPADLALAALGEPRAVDGVSWASKCATA